FSLSASSTICEIRKSFACCTRTRLSVALAASTICERPKLTAVGLNLARKRRIRWGGAKTPKWNRFERPRHNHLSRLPNVSDSDALGQQEPIILPSVRVGSLFCD